MGRQVMQAVLRASYDRLSDVLYISLGAAVPNEGEGIPNGIELNYALETGNPCGVTIIGYRLYEWPNHLDELGAIIGRHLGVSRLRVEEAIRSVAGAMPPPDPAANTRTNRSK